MRTKPSRAFWAWLYVAMYLLQVGWPYSAGLSAGAFFFLATRRIAGPADATVMYQLGVGTFLVCILLLMLGRRIERTLELLNWVMVVCILGGFLALGLYFVPGSTWAAAGVGFFGFDLPRGRFSFMPGERLFTACGACGLLRCRRHGEHRPIQLGARQGVRHGAARGIHSRCGGRTQGEPRAHRLHLHADVRKYAPLARLVAHRERRSVGSVLRSARCWEWFCPRCCT